MGVTKRQLYYAGHKKQFKRYNRKAYLRHKPQRLASNKARRQHLQDNVNILKSAPCTDCKERFDPHCMEYDHRNPRTKRLSIATMVAQCYNLKAILKEIKKCDLVCSNCHALRTWRQRHGRNDI
jgi:hypothetical protein